MGQIQRQSIFIVMSSHLREFIKMSFIGLFCYDLEYKQPKLSSKKLFSSICLLIKLASYCIYKINI